MTIFGYTRDLAGDADEADVETLRAAGASVIHSDIGSDPRTRPALDACLRDLQTGDELVVTSAARLSPSVSHYMVTAVGLSARGIRIRCLTEPVLSTGPGTASDSAEVMAALEGLRRQLRSLETKQGMLAAARAGRRPGRPTVMTEERIAMAVELRRLDRSYTQIARVLGVSTSAVQRALTDAMPAV